jgi:predicted nucleic acid-binding protein
MPSEITIIDASVVVKSILPNPDLSRCQAVLAQLHDTQLAAPALWVYEVTSTFVKAVHFGQITSDEGRAAIHQSMALGVQVILPDETQAMLAYDWSLKLQRASAYDSFYLALTQALDADFWTADGRLFRAMQERRPAWLHWIGEI